MVTDDQETIVRKKVLYLLGLFPRVSPSMLQIGIGTGIPATVWQPVVETMLKNEDIYRYHQATTSPSGRGQMQTIISRDRIPEYEG